MEAKDLMIGDWVYKAESDHYVKVRVIGLFDKTVTFSRGIINGTITDNGIKPIELKKIHLVKNGFEAKDPIDDSVFVYKCGYEIKIIMDEGIEDLEIPPTILLKIDDADKSLEKYIDYVHELQQALRIMGIEKEICL